jgi:hypothetical protein
LSEIANPTDDNIENWNVGVLEKVGTNGVHPTMDGYLQIGDVFYRALVADMKNEA